MARPHLRRRPQDATPAPGETSTPAVQAGAGAPTITEEHADERPRDHRGPRPDAHMPPPVTRRPGLDAAPILLLRSSHPRQAVATALALAVAAALAGRPARDLGLVLVTVLVGQALLGWHDDVVDRRRDAAHRRTGKPVADGRLEPGTVWFAIACATLLVVPLALSNGITAGLVYLASLGIGVLSRYVLRTGPLSFVPWAAAFALYPAFLSYGGWGNHAGGSAPQPAMTVLAALLGIGVHVLTALWGLVADHEDGWTYLPLRLGVKLGATRLLVLTSSYLALIVVAMILTGTLVGLHT